MWILILSLHWGYGTALTTQEFTSERAGQTVGKTWVEQMEGLNSDPYYICIPKE